MFVCSMKFYIRHVDIVNNCLSYFKYYKVHFLKVYLMCLVYTYRKWPFIS